MGEQPRATERPRKSELLSKRNREIKSQITLQLSRINSQNSSPLYSNFFLCIQASRYFTDAVMHPGGVLQCPMAQGVE